MAGVQALSSKDGAAQETTGEASKGGDSKRKSSESRSAAETRQGKLSEEPTKTEILAEIKKTLSSAAEFDRSTANRRAACRTRDFLKETDLTALSLSADMLGPILKEARKSIQFLSNRPMDENFDRQALKACLVEIEKTLTAVPVGGGRPAPKEK